MKKYIFNTIIFVLLISLCITVPVKSNSEYKTIYTVDEIQPSLPEVEKELEEVLLQDVKNDYSVENVNKTNHSIEV